MAECLVYSFLHDIRRITEKGYMPSERGYQPPWEV